MGTTATATKRVPARLSALDRARQLGLVGAVKTGPRDAASRHSEYLKAKLGRSASRSR